VLSISLWSTSPQLVGYWGAPKFGGPATKPRLVKSLPIVIASVRHLNWPDPLPKAKGIAP